MKKIIVLIVFIVIALPIVNSPRVAKALNVETFVVKDAEHLPHFERPEIVNSALLNFLKQ